MGFSASLHLTALGNGTLPTGKFWPQRSRPGSLMYRRLTGLRAHLSTSGQVTPMMHSSSVSPESKPHFAYGLTRVGGVIYQPPRGQRPGRLSGLGEILRNLENLYADDMGAWFRYFRIALTEQTPGLNLRNRHVHGFADYPTKLEAALVLRIAALLRLAPITCRS